MADPDKVARMLQAVEAGVPIAQACLHAGISERAHYRSIEQADAADDWDDAAREARARGEHVESTSPDPDGTYRQYRQAVSRARAAVAVTHVALVARAARGGATVRETTRREPDGTVVTEREFARPEWKASQFLLATSFRDDFGTQKRQVEHSGPNGGAIEHASPAERTLQTLAERLAQVAEAQREQLPGGWDPGGPRPAALPAAAERLDVIDVDPEPEP